MYRCVRTAIYNCRASLYWVEQVVDTLSIDSLLDDDGSDDDDGTGGDGSSIVRVRSTHGLLGRMESAPEHTHGAGLLIIQMVCDFEEIYSTICYYYYCDKSRLDLIKNANLGKLPQ